MQPGAPIVRGAERRIFDVECALHCSGRHDGSVWRLVACVRKSAIVAVLVVVKSSSSNMSHTMILTEAH